MNVFRMLLFLLIICVTPASAEDILAVTEDWPPYNYQEDGEIRGVVSDIARVALERSGFGFTLHCYPWSRAYKMARDLENVMIFSIFRLPNRDDAFKWIPVDGLAIEMYLFRPSFRDDIQVETLEDVRQYMVGVTRDTSTHHFLLEHGFEEGVNLHPLATEEQNIQMTRPGVERTDFSTGDRLSIAWWLKYMDFPQDYLSESLFLFREQIYFAFGLQTSDDVVEKVRHAVAEMIEDGTIEEIIRTHHELLIEN